jgi:predicted aminopeptidase
MRIAAGLRATPARAAAPAAGCFMLLSCVGYATGFAPAHSAALASSVRLRGLQRPQPDCTREFSNGLLCQRPRDRAGLAQRHARRTAVQTQSAPQTELVSEVLKQTVLVEASVDHCFGVASDLDGYRAWCAKGGMKKVEILVRNENNLATQVKVLILIFSH